MHWVEETYHGDSLEGSKRNEVVAFEVHVALEI